MLDVMIGDALLEHAAAGAAIGMLSAHRFGASKQAMCLPLGPMVESKYAQVAIPQESHETWA